MHPSKHFICGLSLSKKSVIDPWSHGNQFLVKKGAFTRKSERKIKPQLNTGDWSEQ